MATFKSLHSTILICCSVVFQLAWSLSAPCYGFGSNFGINSNFLISDYARATNQLVGNSSTGVYVNVLKVFLEGKQAIQGTYAKSQDKTYSFDAWSHGSDISSVKYSNWTALNNRSIISSPVAYFDKSYNNLAALQFTELQYAN